MKIISDHSLFILGDYILDEKKAIEQAISETLTLEARIMDSFQLLLNPCAYLVPTLWQGDV